MFLNADLLFNSALLHSWVLFLHWNVMFEISDSTGNNYTVCIPCLLSCIRWRKKYSFMSDLESGEDISNNNQEQWQSWLPSKTVLIEQIMDNINSSESNNCLFHALLKALFLLYVSASFLPSIHPWVLFLPLYSCSTWERKERAVRKREKEWVEEGREEAISVEGKSERVIKHIFCPPIIWLVSNIYSSI